MVDFESKNGKVISIYDQGGYHPPKEDLKEIIDFCKKAIRNYAPSEKHNQYLDYCYNNQLDPSTGQRRITNKYRKPIRNGYVYVLKDSLHNYLKIGFSKNPTVREATHQAQRPTQEMLYSAIGSSSDERAVHKVLSEFRIRGEWFNVSLDTAIETITKITSKP